MTPWSDISFACAHYQVMLLVNMDLNRQLVNGSRGIVVGFFDPDKDMADSIRVDLVNVKKYLGSEGKENLEVRDSFLCGYFSILT